MHSVALMHFMRVNSSRLGQPATTVKDCKQHAAQGWVTNKGLQGRGGYSNLELGDKRKGLRGHMYRIARQRRTQQSELGDKYKIKDCKAEADTAAQRCVARQQQPRAGRHM